jgi:hypothetical protein
MSPAKTILNLMMVGALLGAVVASFVVPPVLGWYNEPGAISPGKPVETLCNVPVLIRYATRRLIEGQLIGAAIGAAIFLVLGIILTRRRAATADVAVVK